MIFRVMYIILLTIPLNIYGNSNTKITEIFKRVLEINMLDTHSVKLEILGTFSHYRFEEGKGIITIHKKYYNNSEVVIAGVIAHELGHHILRHDMTTPMNSSEKRERELDADFSIGFTLKRMKYSLSEIFDILDVLNDHDENNSYPSLNERKSRIRAGYNRAKLFDEHTPQYRQEDYIWKKNPRKIILADTFFRANQPSVIWKIFSKVKHWNTRIVYCTYNNYTFQLHGYDKNNTSGVARLVNDQTSVVYVRTGPKTYLIYKEGISLKRNQTAKTVYQIEDTSDAVTYIDDGNGGYIHYKFKKFFDVHYKYFMPASITTEKVFRRAKNKN